MRIFVTKLFYVTKSYLRANNTHKFWWSYNFSCDDFSESLRVVLQCFVKDAKISFDEVNDQLGFIEYIFWIFLMFLGSIPEKVGFDVPPNCSLNVVIASNGLVEATFFFIRFRTLAAACLEASLRLEFPCWITSKFQYSPSKIYCNKLYWK